MKHGSRFRGNQLPALDHDLDSALDALTVGELRSVVREALERLDREPRGELLDSLISRASKGSAGWKPSGPFREVVGEVKRFVEAARRIGYADPHEVDDYLRKGTKAFLAGEHATTREVFEALLPAIAYGDVDLGYHELVDEVLTVDVHECAARYITAVYLTTPLEDRADALCQAIGALQEVACMWKPLEQMERVATGPLPELDAFLPRWVEYLERQSPSESEWEDDRDRWLREAVLRLEGVARCSVSGASPPMAPRGNRLGLDVAQASEEGDRPLPREGGPAAWTAAPADRRRAGRREDPGKGTRPRLVG